jgi:TonB family protein
MRQEESLELASNLVDQTLIACLAARAKVGVLAPLVVAQNALRSELGGHAHAPLVSAQVTPAAAEPGDGGADPRALIQQSHSWLRETRALIGAFGAYAASPNLWSIGPNSDHGHTTRTVSRVESRWQDARTNDDAEHTTIAYVAGSAGSHTANLEEGNVSEHPHGATTIRASKGGGGSKWLIGGVAAAVLAGGSYAAWKTFSPDQQQRAEINYEDPYAEEPLRAGPLAPQEQVFAESAATEEAVAPPPRTERRAAPRPRQAVARAEVVPEETIGITPVSASTDDVDQSDEVIVRAPQRPVWSRAPSERRLSSLYPSVALQRGTEGEARLSCTVAERGALDCQRVEETSASFGVAAMRIARRYRHAPTRADGSDAVGTPLSLRVVFRMEDERGGRHFAAR